MTPYPDEVKVTIYLYEYDDSYVRLILRSILFKLSGVVRTKVIGIN